MKITCKSKTSLWKQIEKFSGEVEIIGVSYNNKLLESVTIKKVEGVFG